ncbi:hypothetical protein [Leucobacter sp. OH1287]|uniref:hypothetical protein n=1 Tax=Leucobacter sp. OH1287 TaxID=2491049 RepID=UPI0018F569E9|nr:hypothetical protein [Leucobacter sp. OH1287]
MSYAVKQIKMPIPMPEAAQDRAGNPAARGSISATLFEPTIAPDPLKRIAASPLATLVWADDPRYREAECFAQRLAEHGVRILAVDYAAVLAETRQNRDGLAADAAAQLCAANQVAAVLRWVDAHYGGLIFVGGSGIAADFALQAALTQAVSAAAGIAGRAAGVLLVYPELLTGQEGRIGSASGAGVVDAGAGAGAGAGGYTPRRAAPQHTAPAEAGAVSAAPAGAGSVDAAPVGAAPVSAAEPTSVTADTAPINAAPAKPATAAAGQERASLAAITAMIEQIKAAERASAEAAARAAHDALFETVELPPEPTLPTEPIAVLQLQEKQLAKLPDLIVLNAELDPAKQGSEAFASRVRAAGVRVIETSWAKAETGYLHETGNETENDPEVENSITWILQQLNPKAAARSDWA